jgi:subtilisin family serine protease
MALRDFTANLRTFDSIMQYLDKQTPYTGGTVVVAASGNESSHPNLRLSASLPAAADGVISVGAVSRSVAGLELAAFSNIDVQLMAPGKDVLSARAGGGLVTNSGTSMACPHVAGAAALWWQAVRKQGLPANAASVAAKLLATANPTRIVGFEKSLHGHGLARTP